MQKVYLGKKRLPHVSKMIIGQVSNCVQMSNDNELEDNVFQAGWEDDGEPVSVLEKVQLNIFAKLLWIVTLGGTTWPIVDGRSYESQIQRASTFYY